MNVKAQVLEARASMQQENVEALLYGVGVIC